MTAERLQKLLARAGVASRRGAEDLIRAGRVTVNGAPAELGQKVDAARDAVKVDGRRVAPAPVRHRYLLLNKPRGYVTTRSDPEGRPTVLDLIAPRHRPKALAPVGRLDFNTEGLLLLTDDGDLAHRVAHPRFGCQKTYRVKVKGRPQPGALDRLRGGVEIDGRPTGPARVRALRPPRARKAARGEAANSWWSVEIGEGRTRQIREMFRRVGHPVLKLRRVAIGPVSDPGLPLGAYRELTAAEIAALRGEAPAAPRRRRRKAAK